MEIEQKPLISIAITTYDRYSLLKETINSVLNQTYVNFEVLIGNDNTNRKIESLFPDLVDDRIKWIDHPISLGYIDNINKLFDLSKGDYFTTLSDDDLLNKNYLSTMLNLLLNNTKCKIVFSSFKTFYNTTEIVNNINHILNNKKFLILNSEDWLLGYLNKNYKAIGCYGLFERNIFKEIGGPRTLGNDHGFSPYNDNLLAIEAARSNFLIYTHEELVYYRYHENSPSFINTSLSAYYTAQKEFLIYANIIFNLEKNANNTRLYNKYIINWFFSDFCYVIRRNRKVDLFYLYKYIKFIKNNSNTMILIYNFFVLFKHFTILLLSNIKRFFYKFINI
jgi:glycosyltransferase involved in cell wall biosynthesis